MRWLNAVWAWPFRAALYFGPPAVAAWCAYEIEPWAAGIALAAWVYLESRTNWKRSNLP